MHIEIDKLQGRALAWAAIKAMGHDPHIARGPRGDVSFRGDHGSWESVSIREEEAVKLMREHWIGLERPSSGQTPPRWQALADYVGPRSGDATTHPVVSSRAADLAVAVFRAFIKSRFGEVVEIPDSIAAEIAADAGADAF